MIHLLVSHCQVGCNVLRYTTQVHVNLCILVGIEFSNEELMRATENKKTVLGSGGFGCVYYGVLRHVEVAAKFLSAVKSWVDQGCYSI